MINKKVLKSNLVQSFLRKIGIMNRIISLQLMKAGQKYSLKNKKEEAKYNVLFHNELKDIKTLN